MVLPNSLRVNQGDVAEAADLNDVIDRLNDVVGLSNFQRFISSGTWAKDSNATWVLVEGVGGGGSGGRSSSSALIGGFPGRVVRRLFQASDLGSSVVVTIGSGGVPSGVTGGNGVIQYLVVTSLPKVDWEFLTLANIWTNHAPCGDYSLDLEVRGHLLQTPSLVSLESD